MTHAARTEKANPQIAIVGSGPAALMMADVLSSPQNNLNVHVFERRPAVARKLFIAGASGLNISSSVDERELLDMYPTQQREHWKAVFQHFGVQSWLNFLEKELGQKTFLGTSRRYFLQDMKSVHLVRAWKHRLQSRGVDIHAHYELTDFVSTSDQKIELRFLNGESKSFDGVAMALGGASYEDHIPKWPQMFQNRPVKFIEFQAANVGYQVHWSPPFLKEAEGGYLKNIIVKSSRGFRRGDVVITSYGLEGTPIYFLGETGRVYLDLKPDLSLDEMRLKTSQYRENFSPLRLVNKYLNLSTVAQSLLFHMPPTDIRKLSLEEILILLKNFPLELTSPQPIAEAISTSGGIDMNELNQHMMVKSIPGLFLAGEMLDWSAPTGGFLIQGCVSQGCYAAKGLLEFLIIK